MTSYKKMMLNSRVAVASLVTAGILALAVGCGFFSFSEKEHRLRLSTEQKLVESFSRNDQLQQELTESLREKREAEQRLELHEHRLYELNGKLVVLYDELENAKRNTEKVQLDYRRVLRQKQTLLAQLRKRDEHIRTILAELLQFKDQKKTVELGSVVMGGSGVGNAYAEYEQAHTGVLEGEVIAVNNEFDFVVVNLGEENGIQKGVKLFVYRDSKSLGKAEVEMVHERMSAASLSGISASSVKVGDRVRLSAVSS